MLAPAGFCGLAGAWAVGLGAGLEDVGVEGDAVDDGCDQSRVGEDGPHSEKGRLVAIAIEARSSRAVMTWKSSSAPLGSIWTYEPSRV